MARRDSAAPCRSVLENRFVIGRTRWQYGARMTPPISAPAWADTAACRGLDPAIFYPATDEEAETAKEVCGMCPVQDTCLEHAIDRREHNGVWGGATERERQRIIRRRRRQRSLARAAAAS